MKNKFEIGDLLFGYSSYWLFLGEVDEEGIENWVGHKVCTEEGYNGTFYLLWELSEPRKAYDYAKPRSKLVKVKNNV